MPAGFYHFILSRKKCHNLLKAILNEMQSMLADQPEKCFGSLKLRTTKVFLLTLVKVLNQNFVSLKCSSCHM